MKSAVLTKINELRADAELFRRRGQRLMARLVESIARDMEEAWLEDQKKILTKSEALEYSRYSESQFALLESEGAFRRLDWSGPARYHKDELPRRPTQRAPRELQDRTAADGRSEQDERRKRSARAMSLII